MAVGADEDILASDFIQASTGASDAEKIVLTGADGQIDYSFIKKHLKFGGDGSDGALSISSGTTTIDLGNAALVVKNYTSIAITGTGKLAFSNPNANGTVIVLKSQGDVTLTSSQAPMIDASGLGASGGNGGTQNSAGSSNAGSSGGTGTAFRLSTDGGGGGGEGGGGAGTAGTKPTAYDFLVTLATTLLYKWRYPDIGVGAGGGGGQAVWTSGGSGSVIGGTGGRGGGGLIIECNGSLNFTTAGGISVAGKVGGNGSTTGSPGTYGGEPGGGGGAGTCLILYNTLVANSGTITVTGGATGTIAGTASGWGGGGGASTTNNGSAGGDKTGGAGGAGASLVTPNIAFA